MAANTGGAIDLRSFFCSEHQIIMAIQGLKEDCQKSMQLSSKLLIVDGCSTTPLGLHTMVLLTRRLSRWASLKEPGLEVSQGCGAGAASWQCVGALPSSVCGKWTWDGGSSVSTYVDDKWLLGCMKAAWLLFGRLYSASSWTYSVQVNYTTVVCLDLLDLSGPKSSQR